MVNKIKTKIINYFKSPLTKAILSLMILIILLVCQFFYGQELDISYEYVGGTMVLLFSLFTYFILKFFYPEKHICFLLFRTSFSVIKENYPMLFPSQSNDNVENDNVMDCLDNEHTKESAKKIKPLDCLGDGHTEESVKKIWTNCKDKLRLQCNSLPNSVYFIQIGSVYLYALVEAGILKKDKVEKLSGPKTITLSKKITDGEFTNEQNYRNNKILFSSVSTKIKSENSKESKIFDIITKAINEKDKAGSTN
ncbi:MAG: hypothetical protein K2Q03_04225 [Sphingobacteriaceae bacterium]|nr:hypothetical protein [Sphingobacteriaceae bacterium]